MCTVHFHRYACAHFLAIHRSTCNAHFRIPTAILAKSKYTGKPNTTWNPGDRKSACSRYTDLVLRRRSVCPACARAEAEAALRKDRELGDTEREARRWEICLAFPDDGARSLPPEQTGARRERGSLLRVEVLPEDVRCRDEGDGAGGGGGDCGGWAEEGEVWEGESTSIVDWGTEDDQVCGERVGSVPDTDVESGVGRVEEVTGMRQGGMERAGAEESTVGPSLPLTDARLTRSTESCQTSSDCGWQGAYGECSQRITRRHESGFSELLSFLETVS